MASKRVTILAVLLGLAIIGTGYGSAQAVPGTFADANHPAGAPDPEKLDAIWQVDPMSGQVSISIPLSTTPQGGRGPKIPFTLLYNSASTMTLQDAGTFGTGLQELGVLQLGNPPTTTALRWNPPNSTTSAISPAGPWTTSGPYFYSTSSTIGSGGYNPQSGQYSVLGCNIGGPYNYVDETGAAHDTMLEVYQPNTNNAATGAGQLPVCTDAQQHAQWPTSATSDGSAMSASDGIVTYPDGTVFHGGNSGGTTPYALHQLTDANGNAASLTISSGVTTATDALGRPVFTTNLPIGKPGLTSVGSYYVHTPTESGGTASYGITYANVSIQAFTMPHPNTGNGTNLDDIYFNGSWSGTLTVRQPQANTTFPTIAQISRPDGSSYQFQYDTTYGVISKIIFPTGGYVRFQWAIRPYSWIPYGMFAAISDIVVTDVYTSTGDGDEDHWIYDLTSQDPATSSTNLSIPSSVYSTVTAPDQSYVRYSYVSRVVSGLKACFSHTMSTLGSIPKASCKPAYTRYYDSHGALIKTVDESFNGHGLPLRTITTIYDGSTPLQQQARYTYDTWDNMVEKDESDFYSCSGQPCTIPTSLPSWIRETYTTYAYTSNTSLANAHIVNKPSQVLITDGSGVPYALTNYGYDNHGNLTLETKCISIAGSGTSATCSSPWQTQYSYDTTGQLTQKVEGYQSTRPASTIYTWTSGYLTSVQHPNGAVDSYTYYPAIGSVKTHTDWNGQTTGLSTSYDYSDPLNRIRSITSPSVVDGATGSTASAVTQFNYTDTAGNFSVEEKHSVDATGTMTSSTKSFDGLGRLSNVSTAAPSSQCGTGTIQSDTTYDPMGRVYTVSNPYCATSETTYGLTTYLYDALGRRTQITLPDSSVSTTSYGGNATQTTDPSNGTTSVQHIQQVNGLGMLTDVCEVTSSALGSDSSPVSCNLNISGTGYLTHYGYSPVGNLVSVNQHGMSRSFQYDGISRLTLASNPEAGTTQYGYSTQSSACSPDPSVPCTRTDARGVITTYSYDSLGRLISKSYSAAATNSVGTVSDLRTCYQYDTKLSSATDSNPSGRLTAEWEQAGACPTSAVTAIPSGAIAVRIPSNHDALGRAGADRQCLTASACSASVGSFAYSYNLLGLPAQSNNGIAAAAVSATQVGGTNSSTASAPSATWKSTYDIAGHLAQTVVQDQPSASIWPAGNTGAAYSFAPTMISATNYDPFGHLTGAQIGIPNNSTVAAITVGRQYDQRNRITSETDRGVVTIPASGSSGTIAISGAEQSRTVDVGTPSTATLVIAGTTTASGISIYTAGGGGRILAIQSSISITVNGNLLATVPIPAPLSPAALAIRVSSSFHVTAPVSAVASGNTVILTSRVNGTVGNYPISISSPTTPTQQPLQGMMSGGVSLGETIYDSGTISATVNGTSASYSWGRSSNASSIANGLSSAIQTADSSFISTTAYGSVISLRSLGSGTGTNWPIAVSISYDSSNFSSASFSAATSGMSSGADSTSTSGAIYSYQVPAGGYAPNGDILQHTDSVMGTWSFTYDAVDRLVTSHAGSGVPSGYANMYGCWVYDSFGSRTAESMSTTACTASPVRASWATYNYTAPNNRMTTSSYATGGVQYDASGGTSYDGRNSYWYDAEGRVCAVQTMSGGIVQYVYGPEGERIAQGTLSSAPSSIYSLCAPPSANGSTLTNSLGLFLSKRYLVDLGAAQVTELNGSGTWQHSSVFVGGKLIATYDGKGLHFSISDPLGTKRVQANIQGQVDEKCTSFPFGNDLNNPLTASCSGATNALQTNSDATEHHFTGKERDSESGNDYFGARYYSSAMGRWLGPDPGAISRNHLANPQKWNRYNYTLNNPLRYFDPDGQVEREVQLRAFIQQKTVSDPLGRHFSGDNRGFTSSQSVSSRTSITVRIETDPSVRPGNPIISVTQPGTAGTTHQVDSNGNVVNTGTAQTGLPTVTGRRDANGNPVLNFSQDTKNPLEPQTVTPGISANLNVTMGQSGNWLDISGSLSASPSFELNVDTTNVPLNSELPGAAFGLGLMLPDEPIQQFTPLPPPPPPPAPDKQQ